MKSSDFKKIYDKHLSILENQDVENKSFLILFSGVPLSGKTFIAKKLQEKYKALRLSNDEVRKIIKDSGVVSEYSSKDPAQDILKEYRAEFYKKYMPKNKFIIIDASIDREYKFYLTVAEKMGVKPFIIRLKISKETFLERVKEKPNSQNWINQYERWVRELEECEKVVKSNITLHTDNGSKMEEIYQKIDEVSK